MVSMWIGREIGRKRAREREREREGFSSRTCFGRRGLQQGEVV